MTLTYRLRNSGKKEEEKLDIMHSKVDDIITALRVSIRRITQGFPLQYQVVLNLPQNRYFLFLHLST
jgi:hypothetical protein